MLASARDALWSGASQMMSRRSMRPLVRALTAVHVALYRHTGGRAQVPAFPTLLLTVAGRRTGRLRTVPLVFVRDGEDLVVAAAYAGSEVDPAWWLNLQDVRSAVVQIERETTAVRAEPVDEADRDRLWPALVAMYPPFAEYQSRTDRRIPVVRRRPADDARTGNLRA